MSGLIPLIVTTGTSSYSASGKHPSVAWGTTALALRRYQGEVNMSLPDVNTRTPGQGRPLFPLSWFNESFWLRCPYENYPTDSAIGDNRDNG